MSMQRLQTIRNKRSQELILLSVHIGFTILCQFKEPHDLESLEMQIAS
jgi:hypothetical protein